MSNYYNRQWRLPNNENKDKQSNYSMDFDGSSQYIDAGNITALNSLSAFSTSTWLNYSGSLSNTHVYLSGGSSASNSFYIQLYNSTTIRYGSGSSYDDITITSINSGSWHHIATVHNGTSLDVYLDGIKQNSSPVTVVAPTTDIGNSFTVGQYFSSGFLFNGLLDAVCIFNYALSASQVTTLYGSSSTGIGNPMSLSPKPVAYYPLGDQDAFNGANYLVPNSSLKDYVFDFIPNDYIDCGSDSSLTPTTAFSVSCWVYLNATGSQTILQNGSTNNDGYILSFHSSYLRFYIREGSSWRYLSSDNAFIANTWYNVTATWGGSTMKMYINNSLQSNTATASSINISTLFKIGKYGSSYFNGKLSNVQVFNTELSATGSNSVETLYNNGSPLTSMSGFTSLVGWWKLDASDTYDGTNFTIEDHAGSNDGTSSGMTQANLVQSDLSFTSGYSPYALDFDGTNDYISCGSDSSLALTSNFSISAWMKSSSQGNYAVAVSKNNGNNGFSIQMRGKNNRFAFNINDGSWKQAYYDGINPIDDGKWHHVLATHDGSTIKIYVDNIKGTDASAGTMISNTANFIIAAQTSGLFFNGQISNVSYWNTTLTQAQVSEIYSEGIPQNLLNHSAVSSLVSWWQLGSNSSFNTNWTVLNEISTGSNGTSVNMTEDDIVDGVGSYANGTSSGMGGDEVIGDAPYSSSNSLSVNMDVEDRVSDTPS